jgi:DNA-binding transcriptional MerR regulator
MADWTLDELVRRACEALAAQEVRVPNGRVTPLPDRRVVRWYSTIGLVDRPAAYRGRTALYGPRHLLQVVAVKRRQAQGRSIAEIQAELAGATDRTLREVAQIPEPVPGPAAQVSEPVGAHPARPRFWAEPSAAAHQSDGAGRPDGAAPDRAASDGAAPDRAAQRPGADQPAAAHQADGADRRTGAGRPDDAGLLYGVTLHPGVTLMLPRQPGTDDLTDIRAAARPLLDLLARRGLLTEG